MIKLDGVSDKKEEPRKGYKFHCHTCGLYLDGIVAYHFPDYPLKLVMCPMCGERENFTCEKQEGDKERRSDNEFI